MVNFFTIHQENFSVCLRKKVPHLYQRVRQRIQQRQELRLRLRRGLRPLAQSVCLQVFVLGISRYFLIVSVFQ